MNKNNNMKKIIGIILLFIIVVAIFILSNQQKKVSEVEFKNDYKNTSYNIEGTVVSLKDGYSEVEVAPGSASKNITKYFGNELKADINNDGRVDVVFVVTQDNGGSGTFFYAVAALDTEKGSVGSEGYLLGDRIIPQTVEFSKNPNHKDVIVFNYLDRDLEDEMTITPSIPKSVYLKLVPESMQWAIVEPDFEGEADTSIMNLTMKPWEWVKTEYKEGKIIIPEKDSFILTFNNDNTFGAKTDCNGLGGKYEIIDKKITFSEMISTLMYCEGSQEADFQKILNEAEEYSFTSKGELLLKNEKGYGLSYFK